MQLKFLAVVFFAAGLAFHSELFAVSTGTTTTTGHTNKGPNPGCGGCHAADAGVTVAIQGPASLSPGQGATYTVSASKNDIQNNNKRFLGLNIASDDNTIDITSLADTTLQLLSNELTHTAAKSSTPPTTPLCTALAPCSYSGSYQFKYTMPSAAAINSTHRLYAVSVLGTSRAGFNHALDFAVTAVTPPTPGALVVQSLTSSSLEISWSGTSAEFRAIYKAGSAPATPFDGTLITEGAGTTGTAAGLTPNTRYFIAVYGKIAGVATYSTSAATTAVVTSSNAQIAPAGVWGNRSRTTSQGKILFSDATGTLKLYDGTNVLSVQPQGTLGSVNTVWVLGSGAIAGQVIGGWRRGTDFAYLSVDGGTPVLINATNPIDAAVAMNVEDIDIDAGCVFALFRAPAGGSERRNVFVVNPATGNATNITNTTTFYGAARVSSSGCTAAWTFYQADTGNAAVGTTVLHYYNGAAITQIDNLILGNPSVSQGKIVYVKNVGTDAAPRGEVFLFDTTGPGAIPVQLTSDVTKTNENPATDGRHIAWVQRNADRTAPEIVLYGGIQLTRGNMVPVEFDPFQLNRGQLLWKDTAGALRYLTATGSSNVEVSPATNYSRPWLTDGFVAFLGETISAIVTTAPVFRFTGTAPNDAAQPAAPLLVTASASANQVTVNWDRIVGASSYNVYYAEQPGVTPANFTTLPGGTRVTGVAGPPFTLPLTANKSYSFVVTTVAGTTEGPASRQQASATLIGALSWMSVGNQSAFTFFVAAADRTNTSIAYASRLTDIFARTGETFKSTDGGITWTQLAGGIGGVNVRAIAVDGARLFATSPSGSIFRSLDGGATWTSLLTGAGVGESNQSIAVDPMVPNSILAGDFQLPGSSGALVIRSDDGGMSWSHLPQGPTPGDDIRAYSIVFDPTRRTTVYAGGSGTPNVARSIFGGAGWANAGLPSSAAPSGIVSDLAIDPVNPSTLYGSTRDFNHKGVFKSTDGGATWRAVNTGLPTSGVPAVPPSINALVIDPLDNTLIHLGTEAGYFYSNNGGASWTAVNTGLPNASAQFIESVAVTGSHHVIAGTAAGLFLLNLNPPPAVSAVSPNSGNLGGGTPVTITGTAFQSPTTVSLGGAAAANVVVVNATTITATTPAHAAGAVDVVVTNFDARSSTLTAGFTYITVPPSPAPTVSAVSPASGPAGGGTTVTITGTNFVAGATVTIGGTPATVVSLTATTITATTPAHAAGAADVVVRNPDGQMGTLTAGFAFVAATTIFANGFE